MFTLIFFLEEQWTVIPNVMCQKCLMYKKNVIARFLFNYLIFLAKWSRDISRDLLTQYS